MRRITVIIEDKKVSINPKNIDKFSNFNDAYQKAISEAFKYVERLIKIRDRSTEELKKRLNEKGFYENEIEYVIDVLRKNKLLDDKRFVKTLIESYVKKGYGLFKIKDNLIEKGIDKYTIEEYLKESLEKDFFEQARILAIKKIKTYKEKGHIKDRVKRYLFMRGFDSKIIDRVIDELKREGTIK